MDMMITYNSCTCFADSIEDVENILLRREESGVISFWLSSSGERHPSLLILVRGDIATMIFYEEEFGSVYHSKGNVPNINPEGSTVFEECDSDDTDRAISNDELIPFSEALAAAKEFFVSRKLPECIEWSGL